jgi:hypothetical protein
MGITAADAELSLRAPDASPARRWNRGAWIRFVLAISPTVVFAVLGAIQQHQS